MTDREFVELEERIRAGKKVLDGKWSSQDHEVQEWIELWKELGDLFFEEVKRRGLFPHVKATDQLLQEADAYIERMTYESIQNKTLTGRWTKNWLRAYTKRKGGKVSDKTQSPSASLF